MRVNTCIHMKPAALEMAGCGHSIPPAAGGTWANLLA